MRKATVCLIFIAALLGGCRSNSPEITTPPLQLIQDKNSISATLIVPMEFDKDGAMTITPTECSVKNVPISWSGKVFSGWAYEDEVKQAVMLVRGRVSNDGSWIETMKFSRKILDQGAIGVEFEVAIRYIPIASGAPGPPLTLGVCEKIDDVGQHVEGVTYKTPDSKFMSTDWRTLEWVHPSLSIRLERAALGTRITPGIGCPCEW